MPGPKPNPKPAPYRHRDGTTRYRVRFRVNGKQSSETFRTRAQANSFCRDLTDHGAAYAVRVLDEADNDKLLADSDTLDEVAEGYFAWNEARTRTDRTVADDRRDYASTISPTLGKRPVGTISSRDVQAWVDKMRDGKIVSTRTGRGYAPKTIATRHGLLHAIMKWAVDPARGMIATNPCVGTDLPKATKPVPRGIMPAEWAAVRASMAQIDADAADLGDFLINTGWRWSEAAALSPAGVEDYGDGGVYVTVQQVARRLASGEVVIVDDAKAQASRRRLRLDPLSASIVRRRLVGRGVSETVFHRAGEDWTYNRFSKTLRKAGEASGVQKRVTPHVLRHTHVGWLVMSGASLAEIQARVGHKHITTTIGIYGSMVTDVQEAALVRFAQLRDSGALTRESAPPPLPPA